MYLSQVLLHKDSLSARWQSLFELYWRDERYLLKDISSFGDLMMVPESAVQHSGPKSPSGVQLDSNLVTEPIDDSH